MSDPLFNEWERLRASAPNIGVGLFEAEILRKRGSIDVRTWCRVDAMIRRELPAVANQETALDYLDQIARGRR